MIPFRFIHSADLHLDSKFAGMRGLSEAIRQHLRESTFTALRHLIDLAVAEQVDFIVISGDIYDAADSSLRAHLSLQAAFEELGNHGIHVYLIHGNHDPLDGPRLQIKNADHVHVFGTEVGSCTATRRSDQQEVAIISGISYPTAKVTENTALKFHRDPAVPLFHIAVHHANLDGDPTHETYSPCTRKELETTGYDYWALGHIHQCKVIQEYPHIVYAGNIQGRSVKETGPKGCYVVEVKEDASLQMTFHELDSVRWFREEITIEGMDNEDEWRIRVEDKVDDIRKQRPEQMSIVRWIITGRSPIHRALETGHVTYDLEQELRRREIVRAESGHCEGLVWSEGFSIQSGIEIDVAEMILEESFLGEMLRLEDRAEQDPVLAKDIMEKALAPLMSNREIRRMISETSEQERQEWLHRAGELGAVLLLDKSADGGSK